MVLSCHYAKTFHFSIQEICKCLNSTQTVAQCCFSYERLERTAEWNAPHSHTPIFYHFDLSVLRNSHLCPASVPTVRSVFAHLLHDRAIEQSTSRAAINLQLVCANIRARCLSIIHHVLLCLCKSKCVSPWKQPSVSAGGCWFQRPRRLQPRFSVQTVLCSTFCDMRWNKPAAASLSGGFYLNFSQRATGSVCFQTRQKFIIKLIKAYLLVVFTLFVLIVELQCSWCTEYSQTCIFTHYKVHKV